MSKTFAFYLASSNNVFMGTVVKNPVLALISAVVPAGGQVVKGEFLKGALIWIGIALGSFLILPAILIYFWQIYDAGN